jgi:ribose transport system permease protein
VTDRRSETVVRALRSNLAGGPAQLLTLIAVFVAGTGAIPGFSEPSSVRAMLVIASFLGIAALGQTLVVLVGGIDLSLPAMIGAGNVITAHLAGSGQPSGVIFCAVVAVGLLVGTINGLIASVWKVPPLVVTLATGSVVGGAILIWTNASLSGRAPDWLIPFTSAASSAGPVPVAPVVVLWIVLGLGGEFLLRRTHRGRQIYMLGANREAARLMLVSERTTTTLCFAISAVLGGLTGLLLTGFTGAGLYTVGDPYLFLTIASVVVGGTSLLGGRGGMVRSILGALTLIALTTILVGESLSAGAQQAVLGAVIVAVTALYGRERRVGDRV